MILVTGGRGFIGRYVCSALSAYGKRVVALDRQNLDESIPDLPYRSVECDIRDKDHVEEIFQQHSFAKERLTRAFRFHKFDST